MQDINYSPITTVNNDYSEINMSFYYFNAYSFHENILEFRVTVSTF